MLIFGQFFYCRRGRYCRCYDDLFSFAKLADILHRFAIARNGERTKDKRRKDSDEIFASCESAR